MSCRNIRYIGDELLRKKSRPVEEFNERIHALLDDMAQTMYESQGVGLAAPQVGILRRAVVIDVGEGLVELINPEIIESSGEQTDPEGCLSVPEYIGTVTRPDFVRVKAQNRNGEEIEVEANGFFARAVCHELDHLDGILFVDRADEIERRNQE